jgi:hypothetical protein
MALLVNDAYIDNRISEQRRAIRGYVRFTLVLVICGVLIIFLAFVLPSQLSQKSAVPDYVFSGIFGIGGAFVTSLSSLPYKDIANRNDKINAYEIMREKIKLLDKVPKSKRAEAEKQLEELSLKLMF